MTKRLVPGWRIRTRPLEPEGVVGIGSVGRVLGSRLLSRGDAEQYRGVTCGEVLVVLGPEPPWADGVIYLGKEPEAPGLWLPTLLEPTVHPALIARALRDRGCIGPIGMIPHQRLAIPLGDARPISSAHLTAWVEGAAS